jgi:hypothetical protein
MKRNLNQLIPLRLLSALMVVLFVSACGSRLAVVEDIPQRIDLNGKWAFVSEDEYTYDRFRARAEAATARVTAELIARGQSRSAIEEAQPNRMILDVLVNLLSLPRKELFFRQTDSLIEVDYGVAGYHSFIIGEETEILLSGGEFKAIAGWLKGEVVIHIVVTSRFDIYHRFRLMDENNLLETMEIELSDDNTLEHSRWYRRITE